MLGYVNAALVALLLVAAAAPAHAKMSWRTFNRPSLEIRPGEEESDATVRASCAFAGLIILRLGGQYNVGEGKGEQVSVTIESGGKSSKIRGVSRYSPDSEMTGGTELVTEMPLEDPALDILFGSKPATIVTPDQKRHPLADGDSAGAGKKFLKQCRS